LRGTSVNKKKAEFGSEATKQRGRPLGWLFGAMAGGMAFYDIGQRLKPGTSAHYYIVGRVNLMNVTSQTVQPVYGIGFAAGF